ncbi:MAG: putative zinc-binding metallopeptidase [Cyclobacterium sp.]|uniref:zinc-binding metallopeptidase family protein n=1 Tax=Cyclobacterium sp. TaxID=1966343 RepID=UPI0039709B44
MKLFQCKHCLKPAYFENTKCSHCGTLLGFDPEKLDLVALFEQGGRAPLIDSAGNPFRYCLNRQHEGCNWLIPMASTDRYCQACVLNQIIPDLSNPAYKKRWQTIENAKHRLLYAIMRWNLPFSSKALNPASGLGFEFKAAGENEPVITGHASGVITMNIAEADDVERAMAKKQMDEVYRTVLGHFRHEIGHYFWDILISGSDNLSGFRDLFGDERASYQLALEKHYQKSGSNGWQENYISAYASAHPWEDWAETWAHYLHIVDTLETAYSFGLTLAPRLSTGVPLMSSSITKDAYCCSDFEQIIDQWIPLSLALNSLNRSMGLQDSYPFVINPEVKLKLTFVHQVIQGLSQRFRLS